MVKLLKQNKFYLILLFIVFFNILFSFAVNNVLAAEEHPISTGYTTVTASNRRALADIACEKYKYPWCGTTQLGTGSGLIAKIFNYSLALVGVVALGVIIYGGIKYTMSAGNPSEQSDATQWISGAIWGLVLLFGAVLLFKTINPQIISLELPSLSTLTITSTASTTRTLTSTTTDEYIRNSGDCDSDDRETCGFTWNGSSNECICSPRDISREEEDCRANGKNWRINESRMGGQCY